MAAENPKKNEEIIMNLKKVIDLLHKDSELESTKLPEKEESSKREPDQGMEIEDLKKVIEEGESRTETVEREWNEMKQAIAEMEMKVRDLEKKIEILEMKKVEEKSTRFRVEEEMKEKVDEKVREIEELKSKIKDMDSLLNWRKHEMEKRFKENIDLEKKIRGMNSLKWPVVAAGSVVSIPVVDLLFGLIFGKQR